MAQDYKTVTSSPVLSTLTDDHIPNNFAAVRSSFSGTTVASDVVPGQWWLDTTTAQMKLRNVADDTDVPVMRRIEKVDEQGWSASALTFFVNPPVRASVIEKIRIVSTTATSGSSDGVTDYEFDLFNVTDAASLFSAQPGTGNSVGGIGGGEIAANTVYDLVPDQNTTITADDVLEFRVTVNGSPTSLTRVAVYVHWIERVD